MAAQEVGVEIVPGEGLPFARLGHTMTDIESLAGAAAPDGDSGAFWARHLPPFRAYFGANGRCELIEVYASGGGPDEVTLGGVQLVGRPMGEVDDDLRRIGRSGRRRFLTVEFDDGVTLWSLEELSSGPTSDVVGSGPVVEGVAVAPHPQRAGESPGRPAA